MPISGSEHVNRPLTGLVVAYLQGLDKLAGMSAFPMVKSDKESDLYFEYPIDAWLRDDAKPRARGAVSSGGEYDLVTKTFQCINYAHHKDVPEDDVDNQDAGLDAERAAAKYVAHKIALKQDITLAALMATSVWTTDVNVSGTTNAWDVATGTPIVDIRAQKEAQSLLTGMPGNSLLCDLKTWYALIDNPEILDRIGFGTVQNPSLVNRNLVAQILELDRITVSEGIYRSSAEGDATPTNAYTLAGALLYYRPQEEVISLATAKETASAGFTFAWTGRRGVGENGVRTKRFNIPERGVNRVEAEGSWVHKQVSADLGTYFYNTTT